MCVCVCLCLCIQEGSCAQQVPENTHFFPPLSPLHTCPCVLARANANPYHLCAHMRRRMRHQGVWEAFSTWWSAVVTKREEEKLAQTRADAEQTLAAEKEAAAEERRRTAEEAAKRRATLLRRTLARCAPMTDTTSPSRECAHACVSLTRTPPPTLAHNACTYTHVHAHARTHAYRHHIRTYTPQDAAAGGLGSIQRVELGSCNRTAGL